MPLIHIDTGHNLPETIEFRDKLVNKLVRLIIDQLRKQLKESVVEESGINAEILSNRNTIKLP